MVVAQLVELLLEVDAAEPGELAELHVEDVLGLHLAELERRGHAARSRAAARSSAGPDGGDDLVDHVERLDEALDDVGPVLRPCRGGTRERRVMTSTWWSM